MKIPVYNECPSRISGKLIAWVSPQAGNGSKFSVLCYKNKLTLDLVMCKIFIDFRLYTL